MQVKADSRPELPSTGLPELTKIERDTRALRAFGRVLLGIVLLAVLHLLSRGPWEYCQIRGWLPFSFDSSLEVEIWLYAPEQDFLQSTAPWLAPMQSAYRRYVDMCSKAAWNQQLRE